MNYCKIMHASLTFISGYCGSPPDLVFAYEIHNSTVEGDSVSYVAREGFMFNNSQTVITATCSQGGMWDGVPEKEPQGIVALCGIKRCKRIELALATIGLFWTDAF